jgi:XRE family aerobic/anaerobic benzoate catabolism transcriptional regulator
MSSTNALPADAASRVSALQGPDAAASGESDGADVPKHPFLVALGQRVRTLRARHGLTRKALSLRAEVSERHLATLEYGIGNASILVLLQVAQALHVSLGDLIGEAGDASPEWRLLREQLAGRDEPTLRRVRLALGDLLGRDDSAAPTRSRRIALIGLRGAGKSTLGRLLAEELGFPFIELSREIERLAGCGIAEIQALYGQSGYRRYERQALSQTIALYEAAVIATPGGLVTDPPGFQQLRERCTTVWLAADPEDHMRRVAAQGDMRPMAASREAMEDLMGILAGRAAFYSRAALRVDTSAQPLDETFRVLRSVVDAALAVAPAHQPA